MLLGPKSTQASFVRHNSQIFGVHSAIGPGFLNPSNDALIFYSKSRLLLENQRILSLYNLILVLKETCVGTMIGRYPPPHHPNHAEAATGDLCGTAGSWALTSLPRLNCMVLFQWLLLIERPRIAQLHWLF